MSGSNRGAGTPALVAKPSANTQSGDQPAQGNYGSPNRQAGAVALPIEKPPSENESTVTDCQAQTEQHDQHDLRDLRAQEEMADWAFGMLIAAIFTFVITSLGTLLIWQQVRLTRKAVKDTGDATEAMLAANLIASDTAQRQLRAYVGITNFRAEGIKAGHAPLLQVQYTNAGGTPAYSLVSRGFVLITSNNPERAGVLAKALLPNGDFGSMTTVPPGNTIWSTVDLGQPLTVSQFKMIRSGMLSVVFAGYVIYRDAFGKRRYTLYRSTIVPESIDEQGNATLAATTRGNIAS